MSSNALAAAARTANTAVLSRPILPYRRARALDRLEMFQPHECLDILTLQLLLGERHALHVVLRVRRKLRRALETQRSRGRRSSCFYDLNRHLNLVRCLQHETQLAKNLVAVHFALRRARHAGL